MSTIASPTSSAGRAGAGEEGMSPWQNWGSILLTPYLARLPGLRRLSRWSTGSGSRAIRRATSELFNDPIFVRSVVNTLVFLFIAHQSQDGGRAGPVRLLHPDAHMDQLAVGAVHPALGGAVDPDDPVVPLHAQSGMGDHQSLIFRYTGLDGPNWLNDPTLALSLAMLVHIWKSLPFWTLILIAGRLAIPAEQYEAASVDGASGWQKFRYITWPSMRTLYLTCTILSTIWTLGDFNSVYLLTGGGPADLTHVLATLGIRYLRLDQVDLVDGGDRRRAAAGPAARLFHDEAAVEMNALDAAQIRRHGSEAAADRHSGADLDDAADLPSGPVRASRPRNPRFSGNLWPDNPTLQQFRDRVRRSSITTSSISGGRCGTRCSSRSRPAC